MRELSPAARLKLEELANQPRASFKQRLALLQFQIVVLLILYVVVRIMLKIPWLGRGLSKVVKLSREGPLYKLGVWLCHHRARIELATALLLLEAGNQRGGPCARAGCSAPACGGWLLLV